MFLKTCRKIKICLVIIVIFTLSLFSQEKKNTSIFGTRFEPPATFTQFLDTIDISATLTANIFLVPNYHLQSAPSTIFNSVAIEFLWPNYTFLSFNPSIDFSWMYFLYNQNSAYPAEIENRTANVFSFMVTIPANLNFFFTKSKIQTTFGPGIFIRFATLAPNVSNTDSGYSGTAKSDVNLINKWLWNNARWLYLNFILSWNYNLTSYIRIGPVIKTYIPIGSIIQNKGFLGTIFEVGINFSF